MILSEIETLDCGIPHHLDRDVEENWECREKDAVIRELRKEVRCLKSQLSAMHSNLHMTIDGNKSKQKEIEELREDLFEWKQKAINSTWSSTQARAYALKKKHNLSQADELIKTMKSKIEVLESDL